LSRNARVKIYKTIILPFVLYGCETWSVTLREEHRLRVFENRVLRRIFGPKRENGESCTVGRLIICAHHQILLGRSNQGELGGRGMWHAWEWGEMCAEFWWESPKEKGHLKDRGVDGIGSKWTLRRLAGEGCGVDSPGSV
jgi:hypothetical protein